MRAASIGIDQSANHSGVVVLAQDGTLLLHKLLEPKVSGLERLAWLRNALTETLAPFDGALIGVRESYALRSVNRPFLLGEIGALAQLALYDHCQRVEECAPKALKKFTAGHGAAEKGDMKQAVASRWDVVFDDDNLADAYALARLGLALLDPLQTKRRDQREVMATIERGPAKKKRNNSFRMNPHVL